MRDGLTRLWGSLRRRTVERDLNDEVQFHIEMQTAKNIRLGMSPGEARREALVAFGGRERFKDEARDEARSRLLEDLVQDLRYGLRMLGKSPGFAAVATLSLALGIGANTAVFGVVNAILLQPLPYPDPGQLVSIGEKPDASEEVPSSLSNADALAIIERSTRLSAVGVVGNDPGGLTLTGRGEPVQVTSGRVTAGVMAALGTRAMIGRTILPDEDDEGAPRVVVLSHRFWRERFAESSDAVGETLILDGEPHRIVGVMPPGFTLPNRPRDDLWPVLQLGTPTYRAPFWLRMIARVDSAATLEQASAELGSIAAAVKAQYPDSPPAWSYVARDLKTSIVGDARSPVLILYGAVALILLMASANVANLLLARTTARLPELALRNALGASRRRIARQLVTESVLIALIGGAVGLALAYWGVGFLSTAMPGGMPHVREVRIDYAVLLFTGAIAALSGVVIGLVPALQLPHDRLGAELHEGGRSGSPGARRRRFAAALVVGEFALALTVLVGAGLAVNSLVRLMRVDAGVREEGLLVAQVTIPQARYRDAARVDAFYDEVMRRVAERPGVTDVAVSMAVPPHRLVMTNPYTPEGKTYAPAEPAPVAEELLVSPGYFHTLGIPVRGRPFADTDRDGAQRVAIVNETFARRAFPGQDAIGRWLQTGDPDPDATRLTIVGVVPDVKYVGLDAEPDATIYVPFKQALWWRSMYLIVRSAGDPLDQVDGVRAAVAAIDPEIPLREVKTMERLIGESVAEPRYRAMLLASFGVLALLLASAGIYGVMSYTVNQRRRETGVRLALGATAGDVMRLVIRDGMRLAVVGVAIGIGLALLTTRLLSAILFGVSPVDPVTFVLMAAFLTAIGLIACAIPARRASRTDPMTAIRAE
jgi:putative ABC transport system permease protein